MGADQLFTLCRCKPKLKLRIINQNSVSVLQTPLDLDPPTEQDHSRGLSPDKMNSGSRHTTHKHNIVKYVNHFFFLQVIWSLRLNLTPAQSETMPMMMSPRSLALPMATRRGRGNPTGQVRISCPPVIIFLSLKHNSSLLSSSVGLRYWWLHGETAGGQGWSRQN